VTGTATGTATETATEAEIEIETEIGVTTTAATMTAALIGVTGAALGPGRVTDTGDKCVARHRPKRGGYLRP